MSSKAEKSGFNKRTLLGILLLLAAIVSLPYLKYNFSDFYNGSWQQYKTWFPWFYFIIFPVVKIAPLVVVVLIVFLLRDKLLKIFRTVTAPAFLIKYSTNILLLIISLTVVLGVTEYVLRKQGFKPGYRRYTVYFKPVDSLFSLEGFYADSNGVFCVSQTAGDFIARELETKNSRPELMNLAENQSPEIFSLREDYIALRDTNYRSEFKSFVEKIVAEPDSAEKEFEDAMKTYIRCPVNSNGFRSIEFKKYNTRRKSILLLGDSFTWGHTTINKTSSFADLLLTKGYVVYNTGITGTDPAQYLQIARVLIPQLKPDYVVVNFYIGNDIQYFNREPRPYMPVFYCTNAGNLVSCPEGIYFESAQDAYNYVLASVTVPAENSLFNRLCSKSALGTLLWRALAELGFADVRLIKYIDYTLRMRELTTDKPYSDKKITGIREITRENGCNFLLVAIPEFTGSKFIFPKDHPDLFEGLEYHVPPSKNEYFNAHDLHFNDKGSAIYAAFLDSLIRSR